MLDQPSEGGRNVLSNQSNRFFTSGSINNHLPEETLSSQFEHPNQQMTLDFLSDADLTPGVQI